MCNLKLPAVLLWLVLAVRPALADDGGVVGIWITSVDVAWNPEWVGTEQARQYEVEGNRLRVLTPWRVMPNWPDKGMTRSIVTFERGKQ